MSKEYKHWTTKEKRAYGKKFTASERKGYQKGKRVGFLQGIHAPSKVRNADNFTGRTYSKKDIDDLFDTLSEIKIK